MLLNLSAFNIIWLGITLASLTGLGLAEWRRRGDRSARASIRRFFAVVVVALALFPAISDSDDLLSLSFLDEHPAFAPFHDSRDRSGAQLVWLLNSLEHCRPGHFTAPVLLFLCISVLSFLKLRPAGRGVACRGGRSPPLSSF
jgi:hypothetical protein